MTKNLRFIRLAMGGAILGVAVASLTASFLGVTPNTHHVDLIGALLGGGTSAFIIKFAHLV